MAELKLRVRSEIKNRVLRARFWVKCTGARKIGQKIALIPPHLPVELGDPA